MATQNLMPEQNEEYQMRAQMWHNFTRFMLVAVLGTVVIMGSMALHYAVGWGFSVVGMILGLIGLTIAVLLGRI